MLKEKKLASCSRKDSEEKIKNALKGYNLSEEQMRTTIDTLYELADVLFDVWLENKKYE